MGKAKSATKRTAKKKPQLEYASSEQLTPDYTEADYRVFIETHIQKPRGTTREIYARITKSYWRVTFWGKVDRRNIFSGEHVLDSKFIRVDIDSVGRLKYNDVTDGHKL